MENDIKRPPRKMGGHGPGAPGEKAKNFKSAIKRLFRELRGFKVLILIALILAVAGSILSILTPDKLSELTDEISTGLVVNQENLKYLAEEIPKNLDEENLKKVIPDILDINLSNQTISEIMLSNDISLNDKNKFQDIMSSIDYSNKIDVYTKITSLPDSILNIVLKDSTYNGVTIKTEDKIDLLKTIGSMDENTKNISFTKNINDVIFSEIELDGVKIKGNDQAKFLNIMSSIDQSKEVTASEIYEKIDQMPKSIKKVIEPFMDIDTIKKIVLVLVIMYLLSALFTYIQSLIMTGVSNNFAKGLRSKISKKINRLPLKYFDAHQSGDILSRVTNDVDTIAQNMNNSLATLVSAVTLFFGTIFMMFHTNWIMAITAILSSLIGFAFMMIVLNKSQKYFVARQVELGNLNGHIEEIYSGLNVVKTYNGIAESDKKFDIYNKKVKEANRKSQFLSGLMMPMMSFIGNFGYVAVCIVGALLAKNGNITFGVIVAFITYVRLFTSPLSQIAQSMTSLQGVAAASERVFEFVDEEEMSKEENITKYLDKKNVKGRIEFEHIMFKYDGNDKPTIKDFSAVATEGQKVAIVGPTGAGKTTMVNLLMKFYEINKGDIKIDGVSTKDLTRKNIHELFTMVLQDTWLFDGTIKENIIYNRENISDEMVKQVCKTVGLHHFIKTLPKGYNSVISDNDSVSAGQRQLLTIARAMLNDSPFLILDEATSNVDTRTEELVGKAMDKLTEGKTSFIIAHRLSTIKNADLILVMKDGDIIESGNHDELIKKNGFYAELYNSQFEL